MMALNGPKTISTTMPRSIRDPFVQVFSVTVTPVLGVVVDDDDDGDDDDDDDDDVAIACKESRPQRMLLSSRPYFFYQIGICRKLGVSNP